ncbi:MAG: hypothetical protein IJV66_00680 [Firmicutes bacterium]|nr:hypothetical protein [Bacillota bacterium]
MLGYVKVDKGELKVREYDTYTGYYCGICKSIGKRYGQLPRMVLSYDAAFLGVILAALGDSPDEIKMEQCIAHHIQKKPVIRNDAIDYAADVMLILAWYKLADDVADEGKVSARAAMTGFRGVHKKLYAKYPQLCSDMERLLAELSELEKAKCDSLDRVADSFSQIMRIIFSEGVKRLYGPDDKRAEVLGKIGYHMGKWIYLVDAIDDMEDNLKTGSYNPLFYRFGFDSSVESIAQFKERILDNLSFNLFQYLAVISQALEELEFKRYKGIIENVIYFGLNHQTRLMIYGPEATTHTDMRGENDESI